MLLESDRKKAAQLLITAEAERKPILQLSKMWPGITIEEAYAIQGEVVKHKVAAGAKIIGHKIGLTSKAMQQSSQIDEPDYGHLLDYMMLHDGAKVPHANYCVPRTEVELAFVLGKPLMYRNSEIEETGLAAGVLGHPAMGIAWLANTLAKFGVTLEPGHIVLSGSFTRPVWANKGDTLHADFGPLGSVSVQFV